MITTTATRKATQYKAPTTPVEVQKEGPPREKPNIGHIVIPCTQGLGDCFKKICGKYGIQTHFKGNRILRQLLVNSKDQDPKEKNSDMIYSYQCREIARNKEYIGETSRTLGERYREHLKEPSPIHAHSLQAGHSSTPDIFNILGREDQGLTRTIKEAIYIRVNNPTHNRNISKFNLNHIWDRVHLNTPDLKISPPQVYVHNQPTPTNGHLQVNIELSGHVLNSEHVLRGS